ncbi:hypothetical protein VN12_22625 [Pirellula sp. SH-Sr6A]|nr:hypothetical protein VN12_22625 [Pirellula sp. SH-Sr6A]
MPMRLLSLLFSFVIGLPFQTLCLLGEMPDQAVDLGKCQVGSMFEEVIPSERLPAGFVIKQDASERRNTTEQDYR